ncbi:MAG: hypothetical protein Q9171_002895 [Xanthocarpia ochracea]
MPIPAQFELGLELTNLVRPLTRALWATASLALSNDIENGGSNMITEMKLASLIGRLRIEGFALESGAGPTVQQALKDPALFSVVIQLSLLAFAHEDESLANALVEAIERIVRESKNDVAIVPDYIQLLGTIRACQQQTAAFHWTYLYESVERTVESAQGSGESQSPQQDGFRPAKRQKPNSMMFRNVPFPVLQALIMWSLSLQTFPEHRSLHLQCDSGISTIAVWCHHILGFNVTVNIQDTVVHFGTGNANIYIEESDAEQVGASLMEPADPHQPLFELANQVNNPVVSYELRAEAFGFGRKVLEYAGLAEDDMDYCILRVIARAIALEDPYFTLEPKCLAPRIDEEELYGSFHQASYPPQDRLLQAAQVLFALDEVDMEKVRDLMNEPFKGRRASKVEWVNMVAVLISFARILPNDLERCHHMPLSVGEFQRIHKSDHCISSLIKDDYRMLSKAYDLDDQFSVISSFELLGRLMLGHRYTQRYSECAVLLSAWGWSIFFNSIDADDPADVSTTDVRLLCGVPCRRGLRKARVIDGPVELRPRTTYGEVLMQKPKLVYFPGVSTAQADTVIVGQNSDAFQFTRLFRWKSNGTHENSHKLGFRNMQELCTSAHRFRPCQHEVDTKRHAAWIDERLRDVQGSTMRENNISNKTLLSMWPRQSQGTYEVQELERVFGIDDTTEKRLWFYVTANPAARWLQLFDLCGLCTGGALWPLLRGPETCLGCAVDNAGLACFKNTLVLL